MLQIGSSIRLTFLSVWRTMHLNPFRSSCCRPLAPANVCFCHASVSEVQVASSPYPRLRSLWARARYRIPSWTVQGAVTLLNLVETLCNNKVPENPRTSTHEIDASQRSEIGPPAHPQNGCWFRIHQKHLEWTWYDYPVWSDSGCGPANPSIGGLL